MFEKVGYLLLIASELLHLAAWQLDVVFTLVLMHAHSPVVVERHFFLLFFFLTEEGGALHGALPVSVPLS